MGSMFREPVDEPLVAPKPPKAPRPQKQAKVNPPLRRPIETSDKEKSMVVERFSDAFWSLNDGLAIWQHDEAYRVSHEESDQWALAFYDTAEQYHFLDKVNAGTGPVLLGVITARILLRDVFHYMSVRDRNKLRDEYEWSEEMPGFEKVAA